MVKRYDIWGHYDDLETAEQDNGDWVKYDDHAAELAALRAENERLREGMVDMAMILNKTAEYQVAELMAENDRLREALIDISNLSDQECYAVALAKETLK